MENKELWMYDCEFTWWDDSDIPYIKRWVKCIVAGYSFKDVAEKIEYYYGMTAIDDLSMKIIDDTDSGIMEVSNERAPSK